MRWHETVTLGLFLVATAATGVVLARGPRSQLAGAGSRAASDGGIRVQSTFDVTYDDVTAAPSSGGRARIQFAVEPGTTVVAVTTAMALPFERGRPDRTRGVPLHLLQPEDGALDVTAWVTKRRPTGPHALRFALACRGPNGLEHRVGWAKFDPTDLARATLRVDVGEREETLVSVRTSAGAPVPGAVLFLNDTMLAGGAASVAFATDAEGSARVSGLERGREFALSLPHGLGPVEDPIEVRFRAHGAPAVLVVPLAGDWAFDRVIARRGYAGHSAAVASVETGEAASPSVWPLTDIVLPGRSAETDLWLLRRAGMPIPPRIAISFGGAAPVPVTGEKGRLEVRLPMAGG